LHAQLKLALSMKLSIRNIPVAHWHAQLLPHHIVAVTTEIFRFN
jgi:hypothetical protein